MKNLFNQISESEKERILNLHSGNKKGNYLSEQGSLLGSLLSYPVPEYGGGVDTTTTTTTSPQKKQYTDQYIKNLQTKLKKMGYDLGPSGVDGKLGPLTLRAIDTILDSNLKTMTPVKSPDLAQQPQTQISNPIQNTQQPTAKQ